MKQWFIEDDANEILRIPLPKRPRTDEIIWHFDKKGLYSVKSGYQLALKIKYPDKPSCSSKEFNIWNPLWTLQLPEKIKIFTWRATQNLLPTAENLWIRKIVPEPNCQICKQGMKSISHALFHCKTAKKIWIHAPFETCFLDAANQDMENILQGMANKLSLILELLLLFVGLSAMEEIISFLWEKSWILF